MPSPIKINVRPEFSSSSVLRQFFKCFSPSVNFLLILVSSPRRAKSLSVCTLGGARGIPSLSSLSFRCTSSYPRASAVRRRERNGHRGNEYCTGEEGLGRGRGRRKKKLVKRARIPGAAYRRRRDSSDEKLAGSREDSLYTRLRFLALPLLSATTRDVCRCVHTPYHMSHSLKLYIYVCRYIYICRPLSGINDSRRPHSPRKREIS